jgi:hypothetical protein
MLLLIISGCGESSLQSPGAATGTAPAAKGSAAPAKAAFGMKYRDSATNRVFIYDGADWVPYDNTVDEYYKTKASQKTVALVQDEVCVDGDVSCTPTGAHGKHAGFDCKVCHKVGGRLSFDKAGPAYKVGWPAPTFDATTKTCKNVACHGVPNGTFSYYFPDGTGEAALNTVTYGSTGTGAETPSWNGTASTGTCTGCHPNPPKNGSNGSNVWHSGYHGNQGPTGEYNQCQFCHPDATGTNGAATAITNAALHADGVVQVQATFKSICFGCH